MTTCPSGVNYMHLVDHGRRHIEEHYRRPLAERLLRRVLGAVLRRPALVPPGAAAARAGAAVRRRCCRGALRPMLAPGAGAVPRAPRRSTGRRCSRPRRRGACAWRCCTGCAQQVLAPEINEATVRLLTRHGCEVVSRRAAGCCGALVHHLGQEAPALALRARQHRRLGARDRRAGGLDAIVVNASGCGTTLKDYGFMLRDDPAYADEGGAGLARSPAT